MSEPGPEPGTPAVPEDHTTWLGTAERGTILGIRIVFFLATVFGRAPARLLVRGIALWYALLDKPSRKASREWFTVINGTPPSFGMVYGHILRFAQTALDRIFLLRGKTSVFTVTRTGREHLDQARDAGKGAVLLGAHLGSFESMRAGADKDSVPVNILGHFANARMVNALFETLNPRVAARVIHIGSDSVEFIFKVQQRVEAGEFVAILGDRTGLNEKTVTVEFFGRPARFPVGPFMLASILKCPVLLTFGLYQEPNRYHLHCEPFTERLVLPRGNRKAMLREHVQRFAQRLEHYCRKAPDNWFNFYDFWEHASPPDPPHARPSPAPPAVDPPSHAG